MLHETYASGVLISLGWINVKMFLHDMHTIQKQVLRRRRTSAPAEESLLFVPFVNLCALGPIFFFLKKIPKILWNEYKLNNDKLNCKLG